LRSAETEHRDIPRQAFATEPRRSFKELAAKVRSMIAARTRTPSEVLLCEGRDKR
jgi:plasmid stability protein